MHSERALPETVVKGLKLICRSYRDFLFIGYVVKPPCGVCDKHIYIYIVFIPAASSKIRVNLGLVVVIDLCIISYLITSGSSC